MARRNAAASSRARSVRTLAAAPEAVPETRETAAPSSTLPVPEADPVTRTRWVWYLLSLFAPFAGIFVALIFYDREEKQVRKVGRNCLWIGFLAWVLFPVVTAVFLLLLGVLTLAGWFAQLFPV